MVMPVLGKDGNGTLQKFERFVKPALSPPQRGFEIEEDRPFQGVPSTFLQVGLGSFERLLGSLMIGPDTPRVGQVRPCASSEIFDQLHAVVGKIQELRDTQREMSQIFRSRGIVNPFFEAPLDQKLEHTPGVESLALLDQQVSTFRRTSHQFHEQGRSLRTLPLQNGLSAFHGLLPAIERLFVAHLFIVGPGQVMQPAAANRAADQVIQQLPMLTSERQIELL
jgi:hypothetical protein